MSGVVVWFTGRPSAGKSRLAKRVLEALGGPAEGGAMSGGAVSGGAVSGGAVSGGAVSGGAVTPRAPGVVLLDGDAVRGVLTPTPGYDPAGRDAFYATLAGLAALIAGQGLVVLVAATAHQASYRHRARAAAAERGADLIEVYVEAGDAEVRGRDRKGLYAAVDAGRLHGVPGADLAYEVPAAPDVVAAGGRDPQAVARVLALLGARP